MANSPLSRERAAIIKAFLREPVALGSAIILSLIILGAVVSPWFTPHDAMDIDLARRNLPPLSMSDSDAIPYLLGTDQLGRDVLSRALLAGRVSLTVGLSAALLAATIGSILGAIAASKRGVVETLVMRGADLQMGFPALLLIIFVLFTIGAGTGNVIIVLALARWPIFARVGRAAVTSALASGYVTSAQVLGATRTRVLYRHVMPNVLTPLLNLMSLEIARLILAESTLSFLGLGVRPPDTSWGVMIESGRLYITSAWWLIVFPGLFILLTALSINLLSNWFRQVTDPSQRWRILSRPKSARGSGSASDERQTVG